MASRSTAERTAHRRTRLNNDHNVWIATASPDGLPHLVPLSLAWFDDTIVVATPSDTPTARNAIATGRARAALDSADDVVIIDTVAEVVAFDTAEQSLTSRYIKRVGWDPSDNPGAWSLLVLTPRRAHAWNGPGERSKAEPSSATASGSTTDQNNSGDRWALALYTPERVQHRRSIVLSEEITHRWRTPRHPSCILDLRGQHRRQGTDP